VADEHRLHGSHSQGAEAPGPEAEPAFDAAGQSLANALRTSFRILTTVILILIILFLCRGFFKVESDQKAVILRLGRTDAGLVKDTGMHYAWPYPIDEVQRVWVRAKTMEVNTFWSKVTEEAKKDAVEKDKKKEDKPEVVKDAEDGLMLTGDMNVLQARWQLTYRVQPDPASVIRYFNNIGDEKNEERLMRCIVQSAVVAQTAAMPVDKAYGKGQTALQEQVKRRVDDMLTALNVGLRVESLNLIVIRPPADVKPSFDAVRQAVDDADAAKARADADRRKILIEAAGQGGPDIGDAIQEWWAVRMAEKSTPEQLVAVEKKIQGLFKEAKGKCQTTLADARSYAASVEAETKGDHDRIRSLVQTNSPADIKAFMEHARIDAIQSVFDNAYEKYVYSPGRDGKKSSLELWLNRRPEIIREQIKVEEHR
jgi:membrane protease subunit HflK